MNHQQQRRYEDAVKKLSESDKEHIANIVESTINNGMHHKLEALLRDIGQRHFKPEAINAAMEDCDNQELTSKVMYDMLFQFAAYEYVIECDDKQKEGVQE